MAPLWTPEYRTVELPVFADGGYTDVEQIDVPVNEPPIPEPPDWQDAPELWALNYPGIHYDATLPSVLLA